MVFDEGYAVYFKKGAQPARYLKVANGTSWPQLQLFSSKGWAIMMARRYTMPGETMYTYKALLVDQATADGRDHFGWVQTGWVKPGLREGQYKKVFHGTGNRVYTKLYKNEVRLGIPAGFIFPKPLIGGVVL